MLRQTGLPPVAKMPVVRLPRYDSGIYSFYPSLPDTDRFASVVRKVVLVDVFGSERGSWDSTLKVLEEVVQTFGTARHSQVDEVVSGVHVASVETTSSDHKILQGFQCRFGPVQGFEGLISEEPSTAAQGKVHSVHCTFAPLQGVEGLHTSGSLPGMHCQTSLPPVAKMHVVRMPLYDSKIYAFYSPWPDTDLFAREVRKVVLADVLGSEQASWNSTLKVLEQFVQTHSQASAS